MISGAPCSLCIRRRPATKRGNYTKWHIQPGTWGCVQAQGYRHTAHCYDYMSTMHLNASISWSVEKPLWQRKRKGGHIQGFPLTPYQLKPSIPTNFFGPLKRIVFQHIRQTYHDDYQHFLALFLALWMLINRIQANFDSLAKYRHPAFILLTERIWTHLAITILLEHLFPYKFFYIPSDLFPRKMAREEFHEIPRPQVWKVLA